LLEQLDSLVKPVSLVRMVHLDRKDQQVVLDHRDLRVLQVRMVSLDSKEFVVILGQRDVLDSKVLPVIVEMKVS